MKSGTNLTIQALQRMPYYLQYLNKIKEKGIEIVSATAIACELKLNDVLVRKDISAVCTTKGKPKSGFVVDELIKNIEDYLGYNNTMDTVLVGVGSLGKALLGNSEFDRYGLNIVAAFDIDSAIVDHVVCGKKIFPMDKLKDINGRMHIRIGIIAVPGEFAQETAEILVDTGIKAIWNFSLVKLKLPDNILVQNENLAASLAMLSLHLRSEMNADRQDNNL